MVLLQFVGVVLIVISIGIAKTPDILKIFTPVVDDKTVQMNLMNNGSSIGSENNAAVNAIPLAAILLALVASCNSGTTSF